MAPEPNTFFAYINHPPIYVEHIDDCLRVGSFVHAKLWNQKPGTTTIGRLERRTHEGFHLRLFYPLFPEKKDEDLPALPNHNHRPIPLGSPGSLNLELYQSTDFVSCNDTEDCTILFPAFVFSTKELSNPKNSWAHGLTNVFVLRFLEQKDASYVTNDTKLLPLPEDEVVCFPNQIQGRIKKKHNVAGSRCYHETVWSGLYLIRKAISKILNKRTCLSESSDLSSLSIGQIGLETFNYIAMMTTLESGIACHSFQLSESYMDCDDTLTRTKIKFQFQSGTIRFESLDDIKMLREILGIASTYGSIEHRPRLSDGIKGVPLSSGHCITLVRGRDEQYPEETEPASRPVKRIFRGEGIDIAFSPYNTRITVGYSKYSYRNLRNGSLQHEPPTEHLKNILEGNNKRNHQKVLSHLQPPPKDSEYQGICIGDIYENEGTVFKVVDVYMSSETRKRMVYSRVIAGSLYDKDSDTKSQRVVRSTDYKKVQDLIVQYS